MPNLVQRRGTRRTPLCPPFARGEKRPDAADLPPLAKGRAPFPPPCEGEGTIFPPLRRGGHRFPPPGEGGVGGVRAAAHATHLKTALTGLAASPGRPFHEVKRQGFLAGVIDPVGDIRSRVHD